ncbi:peptidoglycan-binding lysin domain-containing protein [Calderihabitans maritimus]|uniref:Peptidoglycan-binding lysin domain-containing protein n=2 Tax=Calderihabitans maritimus TaxID=1246530 RepID=A0A1Z5HWG0_9FIRM|nr:peptidoglycan-binding lysin domain-containing protein [Calderihabitans maritimus]
MAGVPRPLFAEETVAAAEVDHQHQYVVKAIHIVKKGESLWSISRHYGVELEKLMEANDLTSDTIFPRQKLVIPAENVPEAGNSQAKEGEFIHWNQVQNMFRLFDFATVTDMETGLTFRVQRTGGRFHADVEPVSQDDTAIIKKIYNGQWSWSPRAALVAVNGHTIAASISGMPHGRGVIKHNDFPGYMCIHFRGSLKTSDLKEDLEHQKMVRKAAGLD